jgi:hypothetical protein
VYSIVDGCGVWTMPIKNLEMRRCTFNIFYFEK